MIIKYIWIGTTKLADFTNIIRTLVNWDNIQVEDPIGEQLTQMYPNSWINDPTIDAITPDQQASLRPSQQRAFPSMTLLDDLKSVGISGEQVFLSKWFMTYDFPTIPPIPQLTISAWWYLRFFTLQAVTNITTGLPEYSWLVSDEFDSWAITPPLNIGQQAEEWAIILFWFWLLNATWWTLTSWIDWEAEWFIGLTLNLWWSSSGVSGNPFFYFNGTDIVTKNVCYVWFTRFPEWQRVDLSIIEWWVIPDWDSRWFIISEYDWDLLAVSPVSQTKLTIWFIQLTNSTGSDFVVWIDPLSSLSAWDIRINTLSEWNYIWKWTGEPVLNSSWWNILDWMVANFDWDIKIRTDWVREPFYTPIPTWTSADFYVSGWISEDLPQQIFNDWDTMYNATQAADWVKKLERIHIWQNIFAVTANTAWSTYNATNFELLNYDIVEDSSQAILDISNTNPGNPISFNLPKKIDGVLVKYTTNLVPFYTYNSATIVELELCNWGQLMTLDMFHSYHFTNGSWLKVTFRDTSNYIWYNSPFILLDDTSTIDVHLYDNSSLESGFVEWKIKENIRIHLHSPSAYIDKSYYQDATVINYWRGGNYDQISSVAENPLAVTNVIRYDVPKQAYIDFGTPHWMSDWDYVYVIWVAMTMWPLVGDLLQVLDASAPNGITVQFPASQFDVMTYVSGGTVWLRKAVSYWMVSENFWLVSQWFKFEIHWVTASNTDNKWMSIILYQPSTWNIAKVYEEILVWADADDKVFVTNSTTRQLSWTIIVNSWILQTNWWSPSNETFTSSNWVSLSDGREIFLVLDTQADSDIIVNILSIQPA